MIQKEGWPTNSGPLLTLKRIGLISDTRYRPRWISHVVTEHHDSHDIYRGTTSFMNHEGLRALAALSLEGWTVHVNPSHDSLFNIKITATKS